MRTYQHQRGIALVVTLIMLAVVTVMAVVFLGVSRRERFSVGVTASQTDARLAADAGLARAQAEILARIAVSNNLSDFDFFVSTNYIRPGGFLPGLSSITNVSYVDEDGNPLSSVDQLRQNLTNLFLDPRPPVFIRTVKDPVNPALDEYDFRYYLDLNRNGLYETNGWVSVYANGQPLALASPQFRWGDPEWVGVLENPNWPHSGSNRFVARYAYLVLPAGRSLDLNFIHNRSRELYSAPQAAPGYNRNEGVGSHELNLAAFLRALLPSDRYYGPGARAGGYVYVPESLSPNLGPAFEDAGYILNRRHGRDIAANVALPYRGVPWSMSQLWQYSPNAVRYLETNGVDYYAANVYQYVAGTNRPLRLPRNPVLDPFPGADNLRRYQTVSELLDPDKVGPLAGKLIDAGSYDVSGSNPPQPDTTNRYAFYRLLSQMGTDSIPAGQGKIHLNFVNGTWQTDSLDENGYWALGGSIEKGRPLIVPGSETNLVSWNENTRTRQDFVMLAANAILKEVMPSLLPRGLEDGIQVYPTNYYSGAVHRCLQLAVNLLDANAMPQATLLTRQLELDNGTNLVAPSVFRPIYVWDTVGGNQVLKIMGYQEVTNTVPLREEPWYDLADPDEMAQLQSAPGANLDANLYGVPWVVGVQKGWPNFNEFYCESSVLVSRRLSATRTSPTSRNVAFRQGYQLGITNLFALESWNAYTQEFSAPLSLYFTNAITIGLVDSNRTDMDFGRPGLVAFLDGRSAPLVQTNLEAGNWVAREFQVLTNSLSFIPRASYLPGIGSSPVRTNVFGVLYDPSPGFPVPDWYLEITNRVLYAATTMVGTEERIVDLVTLNPLVAGFHLQRFMTGETNFFGSDNSFNPGRFWQTNRLVNTVTAMTAGITNQIFVSTNDVAARSGEWINWDENPVSGQQRERAIDEFRMFMGMPPLFNVERTNTSVVNIQVPFTPAIRLLQRMSWQANDPLVHYTFDDLYSSEYANPTNVVPIRASGDEEGYTPGLPNLAQTNSLYSPWGGRPGKQLSGQIAAYNPAVQDPGVAQADDWEFPRGALPHVGWMGRVHRGTPWQTVYLKARQETLRNWVDYAGESRLNAFSHPTNDWRLLDLFSAALLPNMTRGLVSVNQTNAAAWAAVFGGLRVQTNTVTSLNPAESASYDRLYVQPDVELQFGAGDELLRLVNGINANRLTRPGGQFRYLGEILSSPVLTDESPFLNLQDMASGQVRINDAVYEGIPQQILGLLKADEPYFVVYAYGQSLRPAERSVVLAPGAYFNLCTNYQIAGEVLTKTAFRIERTTAGNEVFYDAVVEDFSVLPVD